MIVDHSQLASQESQLAAPRDLPHAKVAGQPLVTHSGQMVSYSYHCRIALT